MANPSILILILCGSILLSLSLSIAFNPETPKDRRILVVIDDVSLRSSHSIFFNSLSSRGYNLDFKLHDDPNISLHRYGEYLYAGLILFSPNAQSLAKSLSLNSVMDFVDSGHDLVLAADLTTSEFIRSIASECGVDFDEDSSSAVIDHTGYARSNFEGDHTLIATDIFIKSHAILGTKKIEAPVLYKGIAHSLNTANSLVFSVLSASPSAVSADPASKLSNPPVMSGSSISLVSVMQARNNARVIISGSLSMFSDKFSRSSVQKAGSAIKHEKSGNEEFVTEISKWVFHERGHLKAVNLNHHKVGESSEPSMYRINDDLEYSIEIFEWSGARWEPYVADDVQLQFYMMSPYILKTLSTNKKGLYHTSLKVPDVYGVFQFKVEYERLGYTSLSISKQIPVRPFKHNEYERFISVAFPYYGASFSMMAAFFIFSIAYVYNK